MTEKAPAAGMPSPVKSSVLVVDDEFGPRESIAFSLSGEFAVDTAERGGEALEKIKARPYAAVVLDIRMPGMDGIQTLEALRKIDPDVSVIMLTGYGTLLTAQQAMVAGANQYLRKPPDIAELIAAVRKQAEITRFRRAEAGAGQEAERLNATLKREIAHSEPQIWQARASVELVHDLNNPLTVVIGYAALLNAEARLLVERNPDQFTKLLEYGTVLEKAAEYCHFLSENWRLASHQTTQFKRVDLASVAEEVRQVLFFSNAAIVTRGLKEAWVLGSKFELMRVFQNLFKNSFESGATEITLTLGAEGNRLEMVLADNGSGMDEAETKRALRGGYSSKAGGMGLGLSICRHLAGTHGATFTLGSVVGKGTTARLVFPTPPQG